VKKEQVLPTPLRGEGIVYFGPEPWAGLWRNRHQLMSRFARDNKVLYVEPPMMTLGRVRRLLRDDQWGARAVWPPGIERIAERLFVLRSPPWLPLAGRGPFDGLKQAYWRAILRGAARRIGLDRPLIWVSRPEMTWAFGILDEKLSVYHIVDEYAGYASLDEQGRARLAAQEKEMLQRADLAIVVSQKLFESKRRWSERVYLVPNAVDYEAYQARDEEIAPAEVLALPRPRVGYSGLIGRRLDLSLLHTLAVRHPDWSFVMMGMVRRAGCEEALDALAAMPNVHFIGSKPVHEAPRYVRAFDVCIVPYNDDQRAEHSSPLKIYEYAAAGKPIVSTRFAAAQELSNFVWIGDGIDGFDAMLARAVVSGASTPTIAVGQAIARENTWEHRLIEVSRILAEAMSAKQFSGISRQP
jgi:glycosyltransferase involved in cell wall biosynthesis